MGWQKPQYKVEAKQAHPSFTNAIQNYNDTENMENLGPNIKQREFKDNICKRELSQTNKGMLSL